MGLEAHLTSETQSYDYSYQTPPGGLAASTCMSKSIEPREKMWGHSAGET